MHKLRRKMLGLGLFILGVCTSKENDHTQVRGQSKEVEIEVVVVQPVA